MYRMHWLNAKMLQWKFWRSDIYVSASESGLYSDAVADNSRSCQFLVKSLIVVQLDRSLQSLRNASNHESTFILEILEHSYFSP